MSKKNESSTSNQTSKLVFGKTNYVLMLAGVIVVALGFIIMSMESGDYGIGFLGLTLAPIVIILGFVIEFAAIFYRSKE